MLLRSAVAITPLCLTNVYSKQGSATISIEAGKRFVLT